MQQVEATVDPVLRQRGSMLRALDSIVDVVLVTALLGEIAVVVINVIARTFFDSGLLWIDEIARLALATITFVGGAAAYRRREHASVQLVLNALSPPARCALLALIDWLVLLGAVVAGLSSLTLVANSWSESTPILAMPAGTIALPLSVCMGLIGLYAIERLWFVHGRAALRTGVPLAIALTVAFVTFDHWVGWFAGDSSIYLCLGIFAVTVLAGLPVGFALLLASATYLWVTDAVPMVALAQNMVNGTANFVLLAIPFFVLAGLVMERGGLSLRLVQFVHSLVGHVRGGMFQVMVLSMYLVSGLSGSKSADVVAVGSVMRDMLRRERHDLDEATAVLAASAVMGETIPPSIAMLILGSITNLSIAALFIGGIIPAAAIAICLAILIYVRARMKNDARTPRSASRTMLRHGIGAILPLFMPVILFAGILLGVATPTEVSAFAVLYGLVLAIPIYREMDLRRFLHAVVDSAVMTGMVLFILAAASGFSWTLTIANLPQRLVTLLHGIRDSTALFTLASVALLIVAGSLLEGLPALNVLGPLLLPIAGKLGMSELHFGLTLIISMGVGAFMPPAGIGFYVCCAVMKTTLEGASKAMLPYLAIVVTGLMIVAFIPWLTLFLPHLFGFPG